MKRGIPSWRSHWKGFTEALLISLNVYVNLLLWGFFGLRDGLGPPLLVLIGWPLAEVRFV